MLSFHIKFKTEPHSLVGNFAGLRTEDQWFGPRLRQYYFCGLKIVIETAFIPLTAVRCFDNG